MFRLIARWMIKRSLRAHVRGDVDALLASYSSDVVFRFPGKSSWAGELHGKQEVRRWLERFHRLGLKLEVDEILIGGWPWNTKVALHFTDHLTTPDGTVVYENTGFIYARGSWGKIREYEVVEDTEKVAALDEYLAVHEHRAV
jgi:ketosteroid isomerase-like protein